jgi:hypothetical protein
MTKYILVVEMTDGKITSEWLVLNDESVPMYGIPMCIYIHPQDVPELTEKLQNWSKALQDKK